MSRLKVSLLGPCCVHQDGRPDARFCSGAVRALPPYLCIASERRPARHRRPCSRQALAALPRPDHAESLERRTLRQPLNLPRGLSDDRAADPPFVTSAFHSIQLDPGGDRRVDIDALRGALQATARHRHWRLEACAPCIERLECALIVFGEELVVQLPAANVAIAEREREKWSAPGVPAGAMVRGHVAAGGVRRAVEWAVDRGPGRNGERCGRFGL